jgi:phosphonate transport system substrate-binding protein
MTTLCFATCQSPNTEYVARATVETVGDWLGVRVQWRDDMSWQQRLVALESGEIDVAWICGAHYICSRDHGVELHPLAAPVWLGPRYGDAPVYFSDVVVRADSPIQNWDDLRDCRWAYNEPGSWSGYECVRVELAERRQDAAFFRSVTEAGSHQQAIRLILANRADGAAIDSTVLQEEIRRFPALVAQLRVIHTLGPSPMPPWVAAHSLPAELRQGVQDTLLQMSDTRAGQAVLANLPVARYATVTDSTYDSLRVRMAFARSVDL